TFYNNKFSLPASDPVTVTSGTTQTADISMPLGGGLSGRVVGADTGASLGVILNLFGPSSVSIASDPTTGFWTTGKTLLPGNYKVGASTVPPYSNQFFNHRPNSNTGDFVQVTVGAILGGIDFSLPIGGDVSGQVT